MWGTVIIKGARSIECVIEAGALVTDSRVPDSIGHPRVTGSRAVTGRAPRPMHGIPRVNRHR
jgi:hypothetical protein